MPPAASTIAWLADVGCADIALVGGKNASLGEMISRLGTHNVPVPPGFAVTTAAFRAFLVHNQLDGRLGDALTDYRAGQRPLRETGNAIRALILTGGWPEGLAEDITAAYRTLGEREGRARTDVAVRSSATAEELPDASFAGQQDSYLNVSGDAAVLNAVRRCFASLYTDRAISYREARGLDHQKVALSAGVQMMVRAAKGGSGVMCSIDTETGFPNGVLINAVWGLGENIVQGLVDPDEYLVFKPLLDDERLSPVIDKRLGAKAIKMIYARGEEHPTKNVPTSKAEQASFVIADSEILQLARWARVIEAHYGVPMDLEWARDGESGGLYIVQARPETVQSQKTEVLLKTYRLKSKGGKLLTGLSVGDAVVAGVVRIVRNPSEGDSFPQDGILVAENTDPNWLPLMKRASAIITDHGGRTSHAAIVSREMGLPAVVGTSEATHVLHDDQEVTVSCAEGDEGFVYDGTAEFDVEDIDLADVPATHTKVMLNLANPEAALQWWRLPADGIGLARMEFIINNVIKVHPMALVRHDTLRDEDAKAAIADLTRDYKNKSEYFVDLLARGIAKIAASQHPRTVILRMSDFKTNEYANLIGGREFEPHEENPMLGFRGASRYYSPRYREGFALECAAIRRVREEMGFTNVVVMIPFCRTPEEADRVLDTMASHGLKRGAEGLEVYVMCEIPSNVVLADRFAERFDGFSIGSNDLTQLTLGVDRDSEALASLFDERHEAVTRTIRQVIDSAHAAGAKVGLCGQGPSDYPDFARFLVEAGIDSMSVSPDSFLSVKNTVAAAERAAADSGKT
jgi:pyruvate,water dikinase